MTETKTVKLDTITALINQLVDEKIHPIEGLASAEPAEGYPGIFNIMIPWWDYDERCYTYDAGTLEYTVFYMKKEREKWRYLSEDEIRHQIEEIREDLLRREKEREEYCDP